MFRWGVGLFYRVLGGKAKRTMCCPSALRDKSEPKIKPAVPPLFQAETFPCSVSSLRCTSLFKALEVSGYPKSPIATQNLEWTGSQESSRFSDAEKSASKTLNTQDFLLQARAIPSPDTWLGLRSPKYRSDVASGFYGLRYK